MFIRIYFNISRSDESLNRSEMVKWAKKVDSFLFVDDSIGRTVGSITSKRFSLLYNSESEASVKCARALIETLKDAPKGFDVTGYASPEHGEEILGKFSNAYWIEDTFKI
ncbi:hypothetical protein [Neisseria sp. S1]|uniref:hypothetical protein n=1 Tax=Neisseria sp. S1 TaxID=3318354 RepID=UPI003A8B6C99